MVDATAGVTTEGGGLEGASGPPLLEWVAGGLGAALTLGLLAVLGWDAWGHDGQAPASVEARLVAVAPAGDGWVAQVAAVNPSAATATEVEVEGVLRRDGREVARGRASFGQVPPGSERRGGLFFPEDPREGELELRALGYAEP